MPSKGIIVVHSHEDEELKDSVMEHLGVLETVTKVESKTLASLNRLGTVALKNKLKGREAVVLLLSAPVLSSKFLRQQVVQDMAAQDNLLAIAGRPCAWRIVPWLNENLTWPKVGYVVDADTAQLDLDLTELTYVLAAKTSIGAKNLGEANAVSESPASTAPELASTGPADAEQAESAAPQAEEQITAVEIAAGPADAETPGQEVLLEEGETTDDGANGDPCSQFDGTCSSVLPQGQTMDDDVLCALLELGLILGSSKEDAGELAAAKMVYLHAARKLIDLINDSLVEGKPISRFVRAVRLSMWRSLKEAENEVVDVDILRTAFEETLNAAPAL